MLDVLRSMFLHGDFALLSLTVIGIVVAIVLALASLGLLAYWYRNRGVWRALDAIERDARDADAVTGRWNRGAGVARTDIPVMAPGMLATIRARPVRS